MRRLLTLLALAVTAPVVAALVLLALVPPAQAGGPTSVLITDPSSGRATALYYSDPRYAQLDELLADGESLAGEPRDLGEFGLNLTWMIHDVQPWRTQQLYVGADGGPVVATYGSELMGDADSVTWTRPREAKAVLLLVDRILEADPAADTAAAPTTLDVEPATPEPAVTERVVTETRWFSLAGWAWLVPGAALGAGGALLLRRSRDRDGDRQDRQVLVDAVR